MVNGSPTPVPGHFHRSRNTGGSTLACRIQDLLQLHGTSRVRRRGSISRAVAVERHIIHSVIIRLDHVFIPALVSTGIHRTVFHTVGEVHVGKVEQVYDVASDSNHVLSHVQGYGTGPQVEVPSGIIFKQGRGSPLAVLKPDITI